MAVLILADVRESIGSAEISHMIIAEEFKDELNYRSGDHDNSAAILFNDAFAVNSGVGDRLDYTEVAPLFLKTLYNAQA